MGYDNEAQKRVWRVSKCFIETHGSCGRHRGPSIVKTHVAIVGEDIRQSDWIASKKLWEALGEAKSVESIWGPVDEKLRHHVQVCFQVLGLWIVGCGQSP